MEKRMPRFPRSLLLLLALIAAGSGARAVSAQAVNLVGTGGEVDWNRFYTAAETNQILGEFHALYPELTELYRSGKASSGSR